MSLFEKCGIGGDVYFLLGLRNQKEGGESLKNYKNICNAPLKSRHFLIEFVET